MRTIFPLSLSLHFSYFSVKKEKGVVTGIEPVTSCTQNRNHTTRPNDHAKLAEQSGMRFTLFCRALCGSS